MNRATAEYKLRQMVACDSDPALTPEDITHLLDVARISDAAGSAPDADPTTAGAWGATTAVVPGRVIQVGNRFWRAIVGGTTGTAEPSWTNLDGRARTSTQQIDATVTWEDIGSAWGETWDLNAAAAKGWEWKAAKAAALFSFGTDGQQFSRAQIHAHCVEMVSLFRKRRVAALKVTGDAD